MSLLSWLKKKFRRSTPAADPVADHQRIVEPVRPAIRPPSFGYVDTAPRYQPPQPPAARDDAIDTVLDVVETVAVVEAVADLFSGNDSGNDAAVSADDGPDLTGDGGDFGGGGSSGEW
jgi:uncharacterized membrane protein YgcG